MRRRATWVLVACLGMAASALAADAGGPDAVALRAIEGAAPGRAVAEAPEIGAANENPALGQFLDKSGRLALPPGFSGSLDPSGFELVSKPGEPPRFAAKNPIDEPARWDPQFGLAIGCDGVVRAMATLPDGRIVLGGDFTLCGNVSANRIAIWSPTLGEFQSLGSGAANGVNSDVRAVAIAGSDVYLGGVFTQAGGAPANRVARFNTTTQTWSSLGSAAANGLNSDVSALAIAGSDVYVGGAFTQAGGATANRVARFNTSAQTWSSLGSGAANGVDGNVFALAIAGSEVYVGGFFVQAGSATANSVARFNTATQTWSGLGSGAANGVNNEVRALAISGSDVYVGGFFTEAGGAPANGVARFNTLTQTWSSLGSGAENGVDIAGAVIALAIAGSDVYVVGTFTQAGGAPANRVARFNTTTQAWSSLGSGAANGVDSFALALAIAGSEVYVGGFFTQAGGAPANRAARFNTITQTWSSLGSGAANGVDNFVLALAITSDNLYAGGSFTLAGGAPANFVARFNTATQTWSTLGSGAANGVNSDVLALTIAGSDVYVGGSFTEAGGAQANGVARFNTLTQTWSALGSGAENGVDNTVSALAIAGSDVYVGGDFALAGGAPANFVARFNTATQTWSTLGSGAANGVNSSVTALATAGTDVYVGGVFTQAGGAAANRVARFNTITQTWSSVGSGPANGVNNIVRALAVAGSDVYVGGDFNQAGGAQANRVARFNTATQTWSTLGSGAANGLNSGVSALAIAGSEIHVGGFFTQAGSATANRVARFNTATQTWSTLGSGAANGVNSSVSALAISGTDVYVGGFFTQAGPNVSLRIARYDNRRATTSSIAASSGASVPVNTSITFTGTIATTGFPPQPGAVEFLDNGTVIGACANQPLVGGLDTRTATCPTAALPVGAHSVVARYKGDALNFIGTSDPVAVQVLAPTFTYTPAALPQATFNTAGYSSGTIAISIAAGTGIVAPVAFQVVNASLLPPGLAAAPQPNGLLITGTPTQAGSYTFTVRATDDSSAAVGGPFSGDRQYTIVVARAAQVITAITRVDAQPLDNGVAFADGNFAVQASASSGLPVSIDSTTPMVCQVIAPAFTVQPLQIGTCTLRARQGGNGNFESAPDVLRTFQVKATPAVDVASSPNPTVWPVGGAQEATVLTATVETPGGATPTGSVRFQRAGNTIAGCAAQPLSGSGSVATASCTTTALARGANAITAAYAGDALNVAVSSNVHSHQLNVGTATGIAMITPSPCVVGEACTVGVAVAAGNGTAPGSVQVASSTGGSCTVTLSAGGGSCALTATAAGSGTVSATYLGSPPWLASPAATQAHPFVAVAGEIFGDGFEPAATNSP